MSSAQDVFTIQFLRDRPGDFIVGCQPLIETCVGWYVKTRMFEKYEKEDIVQTINEQLIVKIPTIIEHFHGDADLRSYMGAVIQNLCLKIHREQTKQLSFVPLQDQTTDSDGDPSTGLILNDEIERFHVIMVLLYRERNKFLLCSKIYFRLSVSEQDILRAIPTINVAGIDRIMRESDINTQPDTQEDIFATVAQAYSRYGKKHVEGDSLRRWTLRNIDHVLQLLNGDPPRYAHGNDSLKVLIEEYTHSEYYSK